jgi:hypothetical protein
MSDLRTSSYYDVPPQPPWLRRAQIAALIGMLAAIVLLFCRLAFGMWQQKFWVDITVIVLQLGFVAVQVAVIRHNRSSRQK